MEPKRPTRIDLLRVIGRLQHLVGTASSVNHDRNPNSKAQSEGALRRAQELCFSATAFDPPEASESTGKGWGDASGDDGWKTKQ